MVESFILIDALSSACVEKKRKEKKREKARDSSPRARGRTCFAGCARWDFAAVRCN
jgi:hypothetical protein